MRLRSLLMAMMLLPLTQQNDRNPAIADTPQQLVHLRSPALEPQAGPSIIFVDDTATGSNDGFDWENAYPSLQDGIASASGGQEVWVAAGTYYPDDGFAQTPGDRTETFQLKNGVGIYGGFDGTESDRQICEGGMFPGISCTVDADCPPDGTCVDVRDQVGNPTVLSGDLLQNDGPNFANNGDNSYHVVTGSGTNSTAILDGFVITAGNADGAFPDGCGAGLLNQGGSPTILNCTFLSHFAVEGGAVCTQSGTPFIENCRFEGCETIDWGGAILILSGTPTITDSHFESNVAGSTGGGINVLINTDPKVTRCTFVNNSANNGGAVRIGNNDSATLTSCKFIGNDGTAVQIQGPVSVVNSVFSGNDRGIRVAFGGSADIHLSSFTGNTFGSGGALSVDGTSSATLTNSVLWGNGAGGTESAQISNAGTLTVNYTLIQGLTGALGGTGNVDGDPQFADADGADNAVGTIDDNLRLSSGSAAIDAGDTTALPADVADLDGDADVAEDVPLDLDGFRRVADDPSTADTGVSASPVVDMGAFEFGFDCNLNGVPDDVDIANLTSMDVDMNGIPDECVAWTDGGGDNLWTTGGNWENGIVPNNGGTTFGVTIDIPGTTVEVGNTDITIDSVRLTDATVQVFDTGRIWSLVNGLGDACDPLSLGPGGIDGLPGPGGIDDSCAITLQSNGSIRADNDASIAITGLAIVGIGGSYAKDVAASGVSASFVSDSVLMTNRDRPCPVMPFSCQPLIELDDTMSLTTTGDFVMDGTAQVPAAPLGLTVPPPKVVLKSFGNFQVGGDFVILGDAVIEFPQTAVAGSGPQLLLQGSFINRSTAPSSFVWESGTLVLEGAGKVFEVAGEDIGPIPSGFEHPDGHANFSITNITVNTGADYTFVNQQANLVGVAPFAEALYVDTLDLQIGSMITIDGCRIYANTIIKTGAEILTVNGGSLTMIGAVVRPNPDTEVGLSPLAGGSIGPVACSAASECVAADLGVPPNVECIPAADGSFPGTCYVSAPRYLSVMPNTNNFAATARRVSLDAKACTISLTPCELDEDCKLGETCATNGEFDTGIDPVLGWFAAPFATTVVGTEASPQAQCRLSDVPVFRSWNDLADVDPSFVGATPVRLGDCAITPKGAPPEVLGNTYFIQAINEGEDVGDEANYSMPLRLRTTVRHADVAGGGAGGNYPNDGVSLLDAFAIVLGFQGTQQIPAWRLEQTGGAAPGNPDVPNFATVNLGDVFNSVQAFQSAGTYTFVQPCDCPGQTCQP